MEVSPQSDTSESDNELSDSDERQVNDKKFELTYLKPKNCDKSEVKYISDYSKYKKNLNVFAVNKVVD